MERHILRERTSSHIFFREPGGANACTPLQARQRRLWSAACPSLDSDSLHSIQIWPRGSHHVISFRLHTCCTRVPWCAVISLFTHHSVTAHGVTRNKSKIHGICYITILVHHSSVIISSKNVTLVQYKLSSLKIITCACCPMANIFSWNLHFIYSLCMKGALLLRVIKQRYLIHKFVLFI